MELVLYMLHRMSKVIVNPRSAFHTTKVKCQKNGSMQESRKKVFRKFVHISANITKPIKDRLKYALISKELYISVIQIFKLFMIEDSKIDAVTSSLTSKTFE